MAVTSEMCKIEQTISIRKIENLHKRAFSLKVKTSSMHYDMRSVPRNYYSAV